MAASPSSSWGNSTASPLKLKGFTLTTWIQIATEAC